MKYEFAPRHYGLEDAAEGFRPDFWQGNTGECAIHAQFRILQDYGYLGTVDMLRDQAIEHGWFDPETGTPSQDIGKLLELNGVPCTMYVEANRYNLINELAQGKRVIVTVDSDELWHKNSALEKTWENLKDVFFDGTDHAVVVSGINTADPDNIQVVLTDSGDGHRTISYPIDQFEDAWRDGHCQMIVTNAPPPEGLRFGAMTNGFSTPWDMSHFDYATGHVAAIGNCSFEDWQELHADDLDDAFPAPMGLEQDENASPDAPLPEVSDDCMPSWELDLSADTMADDSSEDECDTLPGGIDSSETDEASIFQDDFPDDFHSQPFE